MRFLKSVARLGAGVAVLALGACASMAPPASPVLIETAMQGAAVEGATCTLRTGNGAFQVTPPASVPLAVNGALHISCVKAGYLNTEVVYGPSYAASGYGGSSVGIGLGGGLGGRMGMGLGLSMPLGGGGVSVYPPHIVVEMPLADGSSGKTPGGSTPAVVAPTAPAAAPTPAPVAPPAPTPGTSR